MQKYKVLLVDDDRLYCNKLVKALDNVLEFDVMYSKNGVSDKIKNNHYDIMLLDLFIDASNEHDGFELLNDTRIVDPNLPIIILTIENDWMVTRNAFVEYEVKDFLYKEKESFENIEKKIRRHLFLNNPPASVFISYSQEDEIFVTLLSNKLLAKGVKFFLDKKDIKVGQGLVKRITQGIRNSSHYLIVISKNAINSNWVERELSFAMGIDKPIIPVLYEVEIGEVPDNYSFNLLTLKCISFSKVFESEIGEILDVLKTNA